MKLTKKLDSPLIKGSIVLLISFGIFNFLNFIFQFFMARMLTLEEYGILATLFSFIYMSSIFTEAIQTVMVKYSAIENNNGKLKDIVKRVARKIRPISIGLFTLYLMACFFLSPIFEIHYSLLALTGLMIFISFFSPITRGILQGKKRFNGLSANMAIEAGSKLIIAISLVALGIGVFGAILGAIIGGSLALLISFIQIKDILNAKEEPTKDIDIYNYAKPSLMITAVVIIFCSLDVILARAFFEKDIAASYAIASLLGKIIFWGTAPISKAMLPFSSENKNEKKTSIFFTALVLLVLGIFFVLTLFSIFPSNIVAIFSSEAVSTASNILVYNGLAFSLISLANLILLYRLSTGNIRGYKLLPIFLVIEIGLLYAFSDSLIHFTEAFILSSLIFAFGSFLLLRKN
jgi:O-antigen/teichoic acid export membrane protein